MVSEEAPIEKESRRAGALTDAYRITPTHEEMSKRVKASAFS
jgi:hypothetical protein